jgi:uncharacterized repeat protein (TIGR01451 family)
MKIELFPVLSVLKQKFVVSAALFVSCALAMTAAHAACSLNNFTTRLQSTGTGPFNTGDVCTAGGTAHTAGNDACGEDNVVRTADTFIYRMNYKILEGKKEDNITFRSSLPLLGGRKVAVWDGLPSQCVGAGSTVSADGLTLTCNLGSVDRTGTGDFTSALLAQVRSTVYGADRDQVSNVTASVTTDTCSATDNAPQSMPIVEISARQKADFRKDVFAGQSAYTYNGVSGYLISYYVYMDQFDPSGNSSKGGQALNSPIVLKDFTGLSTGAASSPWPAGALWFDCYDATGNGQGTLSCPAGGTPVQNNVSQDLVLTARPEEIGEFMVAGGKNTSLGRNTNAYDPQRMATFVVRFFIPVAAINAAGGQLNLKNSIPASSIQGTAIDNQLIRDVNPDNNELVVTVVGTLPGSIYKYVTSEWGFPWTGPRPGQTGTQNKQVQGGDYWGDSGTGLVFPNQIFYPRLDFYNPDINPSTNVQMCEAFDSTKVRLVEISTMPGHAAADGYANPTDRGQASSRFPQGYVTEYGVAATQGGPGVNARCDDSDATWYSDLNAAAAAGQRERLNRVRMKIPSVASGQAMYFVIAQEARNNVNGTIIDDYYSAKASNMVGTNGTTGDWVLSSYDKVTNNGIALGKRFTLTTSLVRVAKDAALSETGQSINQATAGGRVVYKLTPSLRTVIESPSPTYITIVDKLPAPLVYVAGSSKFGATAKEPDSVSSDATGTTLTWTLNNVTPNQTLESLTFSVDVPQTIPPNQSVVNSVSVDSPDDVSPLSQRTATKALTVLNPPGLYVFKSVAAPLIDPNGTARWKLQVSNFESSPTVVDVIDVLPYGGDGRVPATAFNGSRGIVSAIVAPSGGTIRYSSRPSASVLFDPTAAGNTATASAGWCLESEFAQAGCPVNFAAVTAFRASGISIAANTTIDISFDTPTLTNQAGDVYTNRFYTKSSDVQLTTLRSNDVRVTVALGSLSGKVYVDADRTATQNGPADIGLGGVLITLCKVAPVNGSCPAGQVVLNPLTNTPITTTTLGDGSYKLIGIPSSSADGYFIVEQRPAAYGNGPNNAAGNLGGTAGTNSFGRVVVPVGANGTNYNFGHTAVDLNTTVALPSAPVAPGSPVNGSVNLANASQTAGENTLATLTLSPNLTGVVITPPTGWVVTGAYNPATGVVTLAPAQGLFLAATSVNVGVQFIAPQLGTVTLRSDITNSIADLTPIIDPTSTDLNRNAHQASITVIAQTIDVRKRVGTFRELVSAELSALAIPNTETVFLVPYRIVVANRGSIVATNVQAVDKLTDTYPAPGTVFRVLQSSPTAIPTGIQAGDAQGVRVYNANVGTQASAVQCAANAAAFDGNTQQKLLSGSFDLAPGEQCLIEFSVIVRYPNAASVPTVAQRNTVFASTLVGAINSGPSIAAGVPTYPANTRATDPSTDSPQIPTGTAPGSTFPTLFPDPPGSANSDANDPTPVNFSGQAIDVTKTSSYPVQLDTSGKRFRIFYTVNLSNASITAAATNVQISENLKFTFPTPAVFSIVPGSLQIAPAVTGANACVASDLNMGFDGGASWTGSGTPTHNLLGSAGVSSKTLAIGGQCIVSFGVDVNYATGVVPTSAPQNRIFGSTSDPAVPNSGPPFNTAGIKDGDNPAMVSKDTSANVNPAAGTRPYGVAPADPGTPAAGAKNDVGSGTLALLKTLETVKSVNGPIITLSKGKYRIPYKVVVKAVGVANEVLPNVQAIDNLTQTFDRDNNGVPTVTVLNRGVPVAIASAVCPASIANFTGLNSSAAGQRLFAGNTSLTVGQGCEFTFDIELDFGNNAVELGPHHNSVFASSVPTAALVGGINTGGTIALNPTAIAPLGGQSPGTSAGTWTPPAGAIALDASTNAKVVPSTSAADVPLPTPVALTPPPALAAIKFVENLTLPGTQVVAGHDIQWTIVYKNEGSNPLSDARLTDVLQPGLKNPVITFIERSPTNLIQTLLPNPSYNGASDSNLFESATNFAAGETITVKIKTTIAEGFAGSITNQANMTGTEYGGPNGTKIPTSAVNPTAPTCPNVQACIPASVQVPAKALNSQPEGNATKDQPNVLKVVLGGSISGTAWFDGNRDGSIGSEERRLPGLRVAIFAIDSVTGERSIEVTNPAKRPTTDANGDYRISGLAPSENGGSQYEVVFYNEEGFAVLGQPAPMAQGNPNNGQLPSIGAKDRITKIKVTAGTDTPAQNLPLDPSGVVYDAVTRALIAGATVKLEGPSGFNPAIHLQGGIANVSQFTGASGLYQFVLLANAPAGNYQLRVTPPATYSFVSQLIPAQTTSFTPPNGAGSVYKVQQQVGAPQLSSNDSTTYYLGFNLTPGVSADVVHNHIPLDPAIQPKIALAKTVSKSTAEIGEVVTYALRVRNIGQAALPNAIIEDRLPVGFRYIPGTTQLSSPSGNAVRSIADPSGGVGPALTFTAPTVVAVNTETTIYYKVRIAVGAMQGDGINRATARSGGIRSNEARAKVKVLPGVFTNEACVVGKVFVDCNNNHVQDAEELGIPNVRLYLQDGTKMITDSEGKYSYCGLPANSSVLKLDILSMPLGSKVTTTSNRNLGDGNSLYLDSKGGQQIRADFAEGSCSNTVLEQVKARRTQGEVRSNQTEKKGQPAKKFEGKSAAYPQQGTDSANQPLVKPRLSDSK